LTEAELPEPAAYASFHPFLTGVFSQWHGTRFTLDGASYETAEQWMMASKARLFGDEAKASEIMTTPDPALQKRLGQLVRDFDSAVWDEQKVEIVHRGNVAKFGQNAGLARRLLATAPAMLVEANPRDWIWGCGLSANDPSVHDPTRWPGQNLLGRILTLVRDQLRV
jgi:ribA/ribD-fused uncharacterized protein